MKRSKRIYILLGVLAVACIAMVAALLWEEHKEQIESSDTIVLEIDSSDVTTLSWDYDSKTFSFHKYEHWIYDDDESFPTDDEKIATMLGQFHKLGASFVIEGVEDYGQYGLDDPTCTIRIETEAESYEIKLGGYSTMDSQRYVSIGDGTVYLVGNDPLEYYDAVLSEMIDHDETPRFDTVTKLEFDGEDGYTAFCDKDNGNSYRTEDVYFTERDGKETPLDTDNVGSYLRDISNLTLESFVTYNATDEELEKYGLDDPELTISTEYTTTNADGAEETKTFRLSVSRDPDEKDGDADEEITAYARVGDSQIIYLIESDDYKALMDYSYDTLRHQEILPANFDSIAQVDISLDSEVYSITSKDSRDERSYYYGNVKLDIAEFQEALEGLTANRFTDTEPEKREEVCLTVYLDDDEASKIRIQLYRYDGDDCLAVVDGTPVAFTERTDVVDLIEAINAIVL